MFSKSRQPSREEGGVLVSSLVLLRPVVFIPSHQQPNDGVAGGQFALLLPLNSQIKKVMKGLGFRI